MSDMYERLSALSPKQRALFEAKLKQKGLSLPKAQTISRREESDLCPLSVDQEQLWIVDQLDPGTPAYNIHTAIALSGSLDLAALEQTIDRIVKRHEILRTTFSALDGRPWQRIAPSLTVPMIVTDLSSRQGALEEAMRLAVEEVRRSFDLQRGPLMRVRLFRLKDQEHILVVTVHHIVADSWSFGIFNQEIWAIYSDIKAGRPSHLAELPIQFADFAIWQRQHVAGEALERKLSYWKRRLSNAPPVLSLPTDRPRPEVQTYRGATHFAVIPQSLTASLKTFSQQHRATMFMTMLAAFNLLLCRYSGQQDILIGSPIANRDIPETEGLIGYFIKMLVLRTDLSGDISFRELLDRVREAALEAYANQDLPFAKLVQELQAERDMAKNPLFQVSFVYLDFQNEEAQFDKLKATPLKLDAKTSMFDLTLILSETPEGIDAAFEYSTDLFDAATVEQMARHFRTLLENVIKAPNERLRVVPMMSEAERQKVLGDFNQPKKLYAGHALLHELFQQQANRSPHAIAVAYQQEHLSYSELNRRANQVAGYLRKQAAGPELKVGICLQRGIEMVVAVLGILKAGGAYVPLDPAYPKDRLAFLIEDSQVPLVLTQKMLMQSLCFNGAKVICLDADWNLIAHESRENVSSLATQDSLAYVIYTSGSTGRPKGVMIPHRSICNRVLTDLTDHPMSERDCALQITSLNFDVSVCEIFTPLCSGGRLIVADAEARRDSAYIVRMIAENGITVLNVVPSMLQVILDEPMFKSCDSLRLVYCGGEAMPAQLQKHFFARSSAALLNLYGPTESTVDATYWTCEPGGADWIVPIGRPVTNVEVYLLDAHMQPCAIGARGELRIGGEQLARGYLDRAELTAERFLPNPFADKPGARLYRTGDLARHRADGNIIFIGRVDEQVKVRGLRIELGEIENVLLQHSSIRDAVVTVIEDEGGNKRLAAYVVLKTGESLKSNALRDFAKQKLPDYMVPSFFKALESLPQMPNGKIDRNALPPPDRNPSQPENDYVAARNHAEQVLAGIFSDLLKVERVGINDNFFELGGDSILGIQIIARANQAGLRLTPKQLFQYQTISGLAAVAGSAQPIEAEQGAVRGEVPLTPIQRWFFEQEFPEPHHWNQAILLEVKQHLDRAAMRGVTEHLLKHHDALRLRFHHEESGWQQVNAAPGDETPFAFVDLTSVPRAMQAKAITEKASELQASLNLSDGPLLQVCLFCLDEKNSRLLIIAHHLVMDGISWRILLEDMQQAYRQLNEGQDIKLAPKTTSFKQWTERLKVYAQSPEAREEVSYWTGEMSKDYGRLPVNFADAANLESSTQTVSVSLTQEETDALLYEVPTAYRTQINDALVTALAQALGRWAKQARVLIEMEGHGREDVFEGVELSRSVGWFTTSFPVVLELESRGDIGEDLRRVKEHLRTIPMRGLGYGLLRYLAEGDESLDMLRESIQPEASFNYLGQLDQVLDEGSTFGLAKESIGPTHSQRAMRSHLLEIEASIIGGQLQVVWGYSENLHQRQTVESLARDFIASLRKLIAHCRSGEARGFTPSDFPEARLNQADLDKLIAGLSGTSRG